jgi:glutathione peroxidase-family protein
MKAGDNIEESVRKLRHTTSDGTDERIFGDALAALRESAQSGQPSASKRVMVVVAAVVVVIVVFIGVEIFTGPSQKQPVVLAPKQVPAPETAVEAVKKAERDLGAKPESKPAERFDAELKELKRLFAANDVNGIVKMLAGKPLSSRLAAVVYLAEVGNRRAFETLERLSEVLGGGEPNNLFSTAAAEVRSRIEQKKEPVRLARVDKSAGRVKATDEKGYIRGWLVDANGNPVLGEIQLGGSKVNTRVDGAFIIREPTYTESGSVFGQAFDANRNLGCFFIWDKDNDINDAEIMVEPLATVKGYVVDEDANVISDFEFKISVLGYQGSIGEEPWKSKIEPNGSFEVDSIPTGVPLQLAVEKPGFNEVLIKLADLAGGKTLDVGEVRLKPLPDFNESGKSPTLQSYGDGAWNCSVRGFVIDENNEPLAGARISSTAGGKRFEAVTDANGWYEIQGLPNGAEVGISTYFDGYGNNLFDYSGPEPNGRLDMQIFQPAYEWYDKPAPGLFVKKWLNTEPITLEALKGNVVLLCIGVQFPGHVPLVQELNEIYSKYKGKPFSLIAIHKDPNACGVAEDAIKQFVEESNIEFAFGIDKETGVVEDMIPPQAALRRRVGIAVSHRGLRKEGAMYSLYEVKADPAYYLIDKNGLLRASPSPETLERQIDRLLEEQPASE